jgi:uncharacterized protein with von Willebrand factor type A (vWA) domain
MQHLPQIRRRDWLGEDIRFAYCLAETTKGRVFFTPARNWDRYVVWDYLNRRREIIA